MSTEVKQPRGQRGARRRAARAATPKGARTSLPRRLYASTWAPALAGSLLLYLAVPPVGWGVLGWLAPIPWLVLVQRRELAGRWPYLTLYAAGFAYWFPALHWLRHPHPATSIGWVALAAYLAVYLPLFVGLSRVLVHRWKLSVLLAAPTVWMGLELAKGHVLGGFTMGSLGHTQYRWIELIQIADLAGAYGVAFLVMLVAACLARMLPLEGRRLQYWPLAPMVAAMAAALVYGKVRMSGDYTEPGLDVALIQGTIRTQIKSDPGMGPRVLEQYYDLSRQAADHNPQPDLIVWPETMFPYSLASVAPAAVLPEEVPVTIEEIEEDSAEREAMIGRMVQRLGTDVLLGLEVRRLGDRTIKRYNSLVHVAADGKLDVEHRYDKVHLVMFGEYVPLADRIPFLYGLTPLGSGLSPGEGFADFEIKGVRFAPSVCFEKVIPHLVRRSILELEAAGREPDVLVNATNDGWFRGSSELDMHLICGVFRAVECRKPMLIAANAGLSAYIDGDGRIRSRGPRMEPAAVLASVELDRRRSPYLAYGDLAAGLGLLVCLAAALSGLRDRWRSRSKRRAEPTEGASAPADGPPAT